MNPHAWFELGLANHRLGEGERVRAIIEKLGTFDPRMSLRLERDTAAGATAC
jgi:hypothetical protein